MAVITPVARLADDRASQTNLSSLEADAVPTLVRDLAPQPHITCRNCKAVLSEAKQRRRAVFCTHRCRKEKEFAKYRQVCPKRPHSTSTTGAISELIVAADLLRRGYEVFRAVSPGCSCDLAVLRDGVLKRIEVRTGSRHTGALTFSSKAHEAHRYDVMAVCVPETGEIVYSPDNCFGDQAGTGT
jgi:PD-(D/E)XK endonuclease